MMFLSPGKNPYYHIEHEPDRSFAAVVFSSNTSAMDAEEFKALSLGFAQELARLRPRLALVDTREFLFPVSPELQEWSSRTLVPLLIGAGIERLCMVAAQDMITSLSIEQAIEEVRMEHQGRLYSLSYLPDRASALRWLFHAKF